MTADFDVVVRHGTVLDGTGAAGVVADVGVRGGRVVDIGDLAAAPAKTELDATGRVVAPGFIDAHAHTDQTAFLPDEHHHIRLASVRQGVTTEVSGNCGMSPFPHADPSDAAGGSTHTRHFRTFATLAGYRSALQEAGLTVNIAPLVGHAALRGVAVGLDQRLPTPEELTQMRRHLRRALEEGAVGLSTGLAFSPGWFADLDELVALAREVAAAGRVYVTHMRNEGDMVVEALTEALTIGRRSGAPVQVSHHKIGLQRNWGRSAETLAMIERARAAGQDVAIDVYPYTASSNGLSAFLPMWALAGGAEAMTVRLRDPETRRRIVAELAGGGPRGRGSWEPVVLASADGYAEVCGQTIDAIAKDHGRDPADLVCDVVAADPYAMVITHGLDPDEVRTIGSQPFAMVGSDGIPLPGHQHPRVAGSFARVLRAAADAPGDRALADLVRRMTSLPAQRFGLRDRGVLASGKAADLVVFDPATVADGATYDEPWLPPTGVDHVVVNGVVVIRDGRDTGARSGEVLAPA